MFVVVVVHLPPEHSVLLVDVPVVLPEPFCVVVVGPAAEPCVHVTQTDVPLTVPGHLPRGQLLGSL
jgi:hypothetical protein